MKPVTRHDLQKVGDYVYEVPQTFRHDMRVPAHFYADDDILGKALEDRSLEQLVNTATLPGVVGHAMAMPDIHEGYGFPIGGVVATRLPSGVISPGGVGYDINCIAGDTPILHDFGYTIPIAEMAADWEQSVLCCQDFASGHSDSAHIVRFLQQPPSAPVYRIVTEDGHQLTATADHPFWTPDGMIELKRIRPGGRIAVYPFAGVEYTSPAHEPVVEQAAVEKVLLAAGKSYGRGGIPKAIEGLRKRGLLPLYSDSLAFPRLLRLMGYVWGDGTMNFARRRTEGVLMLYGQADDIEIVRNDLIELGYGPTEIRHRQRTSRLTLDDGVHEFSGGISDIEVNSTGLVALLVALGVPSGKKSEQDFVVPSWLKKAPRWQKRLFLAGLFGAELSKPAVRPGRTHGFQQPRLSLNKRDPFLVSGYQFLTEIANLACDFGVETEGISQERGRSTNRDGSVSHTLRLVFSAKSESLINLWSTIGFEYNRQRQMLANTAVQYLRHKQMMVSERDSVRRQASMMYASGAAPRQIIAALEADRSATSGVNVRFLERSIYGEAAQVYVGREFLGFEDYCHQATTGLGQSGMVWEHVACIEPVDYHGDVYDFTVAHADHNFVANGFVVSNCGVRLLGTHLDADELPLTWIAWPMPSTGRCPAASA